MSFSPTRVAVYGTLKQNGSNHHLLAGLRFLGRCKLKSITLYDLGPYPAARLIKSRGVEVEVYQVSEKMLARLDRLEGYDPGSPETGLYNRVQLETLFGKAWVYIYNHSVTGCPTIRYGGWPA